MQHDLPPARSTETTVCSETLTSFAFPFLLLGITALFTSPAYAWSPKGHYWISSKAIECLEDRLKESFLKRRAVLIKHSMSPDYRKDKDPEERFRHYIDLDQYGAFPFPQLNLDYERLVKRFGKGRVQRNGVVLWVVETTFGNLVEAFKDTNQEEILRYSSDLAHYVADLHQPLHTVKNYDGQMTGQHGIHSRFETGLLNFYLDEIAFLPARPTDLGPVLQAGYTMAKESFVWADDILLADQKVVSTLGIDRHKFRSRREKKPYPDLYYFGLFQEISPILRRQLNRAAQRLASLWSMAYQRAGKPAF